MASVSTLAEAAVSQKPARTTGRPRKCRGAHARPSLRASDLITHAKKWPVALTRMASSLMRNDRITCCEHKRHADHSCQKMTSILLSTTAEPSSNSAASAGERNSRGGLSEAQTPPRASSGMISRPGSRRSGSMSRLLRDGRTTGHPRKCRGVPSSRVISNAEKRKGHIRTVITHTEPAVIPTRAAQPRA